MTRKYPIGYTGQGNNGEYYVIIDNPPNNRRCKVRFSKTGYEKWVHKGNLCRGEVRDNTSQCMGRGIFDTYPIHLNTKSHVTWKSMFDRCYSGTSLNKRPTYKGCEVCDEWRIFSTFKRWFDDNYREGWHLDKDIKLKGNKMYCPDLCMFVPPVINSITVNSKGIRGNLPVGVTKCNSLTNPYKADIKYTEDGEVLRKYIGCYKTPESAFNAYRKEKLKIISEKVTELYEKGVIDSEMRSTILKYDINIED